MEFLRWHAKVISLFVIMFTILIFVMLPIKVAGIFERKGEKGKVVLAVLNCFSGGVFLGTYLLHMAPEVRELLEESLLEPNHIEYPIPELIIGLGFFLVLFLEKSVMSINTVVSEKKSKGGDDIVLNKVTPKQQDLNQNDKTDPPSYDGHQNPAFDAENQEKGINGDVPTTKPIEQHNHGDHDHEGGGHDDMAARSMIMMMALTLHCIFEGMSVGLKTSMQGVWNLLIAIVTHETVIAFSLGLQLVRHNPTKRVVIAGCLYCIMTPLGVAIGTAIMETQGSSSTIDLVNGILQGIAAGTFIYVTFFEILYGQISHDSPFLYIFALLFGFGLMAALSAIPEGSDEESPGNSTALDSFEHYRSAFSVFL